MCLLLCGCREPLVHDLSEMDANRFLTRLHESNIDADKEKQGDGKWVIEVPRGTSAASIKILDGARLLKRGRVQNSAAPGVISSREDQRLHAERIISQEIEDTLSSIGGVLEAHVHLKLPPQDPLFGRRSGDSGSASVLIVVDAEPRISKEEISSLVAGAAGIDTKAVSVIVSSQESAAQENRDGARKESAPVHAQVHAPAWRTNSGFTLLTGVLLSCCSLVLGLLLWRTRRHAGEVV